MNKTKNVKGEKKPKKTSSVEMVEYSIKMVIPTGAFANIQPEIKVKASTPEEAHEYIAPHMNKLWKEYFMVNERRTEIAPSPTETHVNTIENSPVPPPTNATVTEQAPASNVALIKARQAIQGCTSLEAMELIKNQVELSIKLAPEDKVGLRAMIAEKINEINADTFIKRNG